MNIARFAGVVGVLGVAWVVQGKKPALPPEPVVNHTASSANGQRIEHGELILGVDEANKKLNAQHHSYKVLETRRVPGPFTKPEMKELRQLYEERVRIAKYVGVIRRRRDALRSNAASN